MKWIRDELHKIRSQGMYRRLHRVSTAQEAEFVLDGKAVINFSGNNSLGLATHPALREAAQEALERYGVGAGASRLISGNMVPHEDLEQALAAFLGRERALLFSSGFQANTGALPVLAGPEDLILSDELNHASLIDGIRLSRAQVKIYPHNDVEAAAVLLAEAPAEQKVLVVTESLFSMEGDRARLADLAALKGKRPFLLYVDEAHAIASTGPGGRGLAAEAGCEAAVDLLLGTLGKGMGVSGAFMAGSEALVDLLMNRTRSFIYTTAPPPLLAAAALASLREVERGRALREQLHDNVKQFRRMLTDLTGQDIPGQDHIIPLLVPGAERVMEVCAALLERGIFCQGIRPPTVPLGQCRLRFSLSALHTREHLDKTLAALKEVL